MRFSLIFIVFALIGCVEEFTGPITENTIVGVWQLEATRISPGGEAVHSNITNGPIYRFNGDGTYTLSDPKNMNNTQSGTYVIENDKLILHNTEDEDTFIQFLSRFSEGKLLLNFAGCIEECTYIYTRKG